VLCERGDIVRPGDTYPRNTALAILVSGAPGAGKTNFCMEFPDPWFADADQNLRNAVDRHPGKHFTYDCPEFDTDDKGNIVKRYADHEHWPRLETIIKAAGPDPKVGTIVVDGLGRVADYLRAYLVHTGGQAEKPLLVGGLKVMTMSLWGPFSDLMKKLVFLCRSYNKPFLMTTHLGVDENELTTVKEQKVLLQGALKADYPKLYTDFVMCKAEPNAGERYKPYGVRYSVRTAPDSRITLKQSCGLPAEFEVTDDAFKQLIERLTVKPTPTPLPPSGGTPSHQASEVATNNVTTK
jgi:hypothetical protein